VSAFIATCSNVASSEDASASLRASAASAVNGVLFGAFLSLCARREPPGVGAGGADQPRGGVIPANALEEIRKAVPGARRAAVARLYGAAGAAGTGDGDLTTAALGTCAILAACGVLDAEWSGALDVSDVDAVNALCAVGLGSTRSADRALALESLAFLCFDTGSGYGGSGDGGSGDGGDGGVVRKLARAAARAGMCAGESDLEREAACACACALMASSSSSSSSSRGTDAAAAAAAAENHDSLDDGWAETLLQEWLLGGGGGGDGGGGGVHGAIVMSSTPHDDDAGLFFAATLARTSPRAFGRVFRPGGDATAKTVAKAVAAAAATRGRSGGALAFLRALVPSSRSGETGETGVGATAETSGGGEGPENGAATRHLSRGDFVGVRDALLRAVETAAGDADDDDARPRGIASAVGHARVGHATHATRLHAILPWLAARRGSVDGLGELRALADDAAAAAAAAVRLLPIRPRSRGARRSLRTFPVVTLYPRFPFNV
jgi:hypothetical protein